MRQPTVAPPAAAAQGLLPTANRLAAQVLPKGCPRQPPAVPLVLCPQLPRHLLQLALQGRALLQALWLLLPPFHPSPYQSMPALAALHQRRVWGAATTGAGSRGLILELLSLLLPPALQAPRSLPTAAPLLPLEPQIR